ncbi:hypothetical protein AeMF1_019239 [Aphanomyces euteiches]|nr:hypothetical protein AeMF1_019239 [Aphanomyces euteiches]
MGTPPPLDHLRVFGCKVMVHIPSVHRSKLATKARAGVFVGYSKDSLSYLIYIADQGKGEIVHSRDVVFFENEFCEQNTGGAIDIPEPVGAATSTSYTHPTPISDDSFPNYISYPGIYDLSNSGEGSQHEFDRSTNNNSGRDGSIQTETHIQAHSDGDNIFATPPVARQLRFDLDEDESMSSGQPIGTGSNSARETTTTRAGRVVRPPNRLTSDGHFGLIAMAGDPQSRDEALSRPDATEWKNAMDSEIQSLIANGTSDCVPLPAGRKAIKTKWVFKIKMLPSGEIDKYKARLVAGGYSQVHGIDYTETFSPVVKYSTIRFLLALSVQHKWQIGQADVKTAFVKADLDELIYVMPAEGYSEPDGKVWQLKKALYGLKQSSRAWWISLTTFMIENGIYTG